MAIKTENFEFEIDTDLIHTINAKIYIKINRRVVYKLFEYMPAVKEQHHEIFEINKSGIFPVSDCISFFINNNKVILSVSMDLKHRVSEIKCCLFLYESEKIYHKKEFYYSDKPMRGKKKIPYALS